MTIPATRKAVGQVPAEPRRSDSDPVKALWREVRLQVALFAAALVLVVIFTAGAVTDWPWYVLAFPYVGVIAVLVELQFRQPRRVRAITCTLRDDAEARPPARKIGRSVRLRYRWGCFKDWCIGRRMPSREVLADARRGGYAVGHKAGLHEGRAAMLADATTAIRERYVDTSQGIVCSDFRQAADFLQQRFGPDAPALDEDRGQP